jgi:hypothetical protein
MKNLIGLTLAAMMLMPSPVKADDRTGAIVAGAIILGIAGIAAANAERRRERHRHHYYTPPPHRYHGHSYPPPHRYHGHSYPPPRLMYRERHYYDHHRPHHHHWR